MKMEHDNISIPCLLDDLEDEGVIKFDIDFGMLSGQKKGAVKGSPSHESDSGVSDMVDLDTDLRSISPSSDGIGEVGSTANLFDFDAFSSQLLDEELDAELAGYFEKTDESDDNNNVTGSRMATSPPSSVNQKVTVRCAITSPVLSISPEKDVDIESEQSDQECVNEVTEHDVVDKRKLVKPKRHVKFNDNTDVHILPSKSKRVPESTATVKPSVKVVKVIKTPATAPSTSLDNQVIQAIDERNKKNAVQAKMNREKKKAYIRSLEDEIDNLQMKNFALNSSNKKILKEKDALKEEVEYLKGIIANQSVLSGLLKNIGNVDNVKLSSSFVQRKRSAEMDHDYDNSAKRVKTTKTTAGVCLHVDQGNVSIEFCSKCAGMAQSTLDDKS